MTEVSTIPDVYASLIPHTPNDPGFFDLGIKEQLKYYKSLIADFKVPKFTGCPYCLHSIKQRGCGCINCSCSPLAQIVSVDKYIQSLYFDKDIYEAVKNKLLDLLQIYKNHTSSQMDENIKKYLGESSIAKDFLNFYLLSALSGAKIEGAEKEYKESADELSRRMFNYILLATFGEMRYGIRTSTMKSVDWMEDERLFSIFLAVRKVKLNGYRSRREQMWLAAGDLQEIVPARMLLELAKAIFTYAKFDNSQIGGKKWANICDVGIKYLDGEYVNAEIFVDHAKQHIPNYELVISKCVDVCKELLNSAALCDQKINDVKLFEKQNKDKAFEDYKLICQQMKCSK